ncbi:MAG TPA: DUF1552 domain-containing protein [Planctomycetota bacterium]|nr:DUF1552 domain-containing protein [Planctomycetota bacterium]
MDQRWLISRRTVLRGLGATMALPLLESMGWAEPRAAKLPVRIGFMYMPDGVNQKEFWPSNPAAFPQLLPSSLEPLRPVLDQCLLLDGIDNVNRSPFNDAAHAIELSTWLTATLPDATRRDTISIAPSADQIAAEQLGQYTMLPSVELGTRANELTGIGQDGLNKRYYTTGNFRTATQPLPVMVSPAEVYKRLFATRGAVRKAGGPEIDAGQFAASSAPSDAPKGESLDRSMLDLVRESAADLQRRVSRDDQSQIDDYLDSVRQLEKRVAAVEQRRASVVKAAATPPVAASSVARSAPLEVKIPAGDIAWSEHVRVLGDLLVLAFQTDVTRVGTLITSMNQGIRYPELGQSEAHHELSHHGGDAAKLAAVAKIDRFNLEQFAYVAGRMKGLKEGPGSLLDNTILMWGSGLGDGDSHTHQRLPTILAGKGGGTVRVGRYAKAHGNQGDLLTAILARAGVKLPKPIGIGTKLLQELA